MELATTRLLIFLGWLLEPLPAACHVSSWWTQSWTICCLISNHGSTLGKTAKVSQRKCHWGIGSVTGEISSKDQVSTIEQEGGSAWHLPASKTKGPSVQPITMGCSRSGYSSTFLPFLVFYSPCLLRHVAHSIINNNLMIPAFFWGVMTLYHDSPACSSSKVPCLPAWTAWLAKGFLNLKASKF